MDAEILQGFIRQAEEYLPAIRGGILVCTRANSIYGELDASLRQIEAIKNAASIIDLTEIVKICREFEQTLKTVRVSKEPLGDEQARRLLDKLAELEAAVTELYFNDDGFSENLSGFVEDSFEKFQIGIGKCSGAATGDGESFEIDDETLEVFAREADELLRNIRTNLERLEKFPTDREALLEIRRSAHTLKGSAAIVGLERLSRIAHRVEDLLDYLAEKEIGCNAETFEMLLTSIECFEVLARDEKSPQIEKKISRVCENFDALITSLQTRAAPETSLDIDKIAPSILEETAKDSVANVGVQNRPVVRVSLEKLDDLVKL
ncbi:MAG TPA: Hpt domain-containing protein, partial [Pyrinomonadaceae bacterium]|nr:Hpt domain-containing protein [Pyrinomonadaceae bacterium]